MLCGLVLLLNRFILIFWITVKLLVTVKIAFIKLGSNSNMQRRRINIRVYVGLIDKEGCGVHMVVEKRVCYSAWHITK